MDQSELLIQYRLYVELTDRLSQRRLQVNGFYVTILSAPLVFGLSFSKLWGAGFVWWGQCLPGVLGIFLCIVWWFHINSFRQLSSGRFSVIKEMEEMLSFPCFRREWEILASGRNMRHYFRFTVIERFVPVGIGGIYLGFLVSGILEILK